MRLFLTGINCCLFLLINSYIGVAQEDIFPCYISSTSGSDALGNVNYTFKYYPNKETAQNGTPQINTGSAPNHAEAHNQIKALTLKYENYKVAVQSATPQFAKNTKLSLKDATKQLEAIKSGYEHLEKLKQKPLRSCPTLGGNIVGITPK